MSVIDFLADCEAWRSWVESASPSALERDPIQGHKSMNYAEVLLQALSLPRPRYTNREMR